MCNSNFDRTPRRNCRLKRSQKDRFLLATAPGQGQQLQSPMTNRCKSAVFLPSGGCIVTTEDRRSYTKFCQELSSKRYLMATAEVKSSGQQLHQHHRFLHYCQPTTHHPLPHFLLCPVVTTTEVHSPPCFPPCHPPRAAPALPSASPAQFPRHRSITRHNSEPRHPRHCAQARPLAGRARLAPPPALLGAPPWLMTPTHESARIVVSLAKSMMSMRVTSGLSFSPLFRASFSTPPPLIVLSATFGYM